MLYMTWSIYIKFKQFSITIKGFSLLFTLNDITGSQALSLHLKDPKLPQLGI